MRAIAQDKKTAALMGVNVDNVISQDISLSAVSSLVQPVSCGGFKWV